jgi:tail protein
MLVHVKTFDGHNINDGTSYEAFGTAWNMLPAAKPAILEQMQSDPLDSGAWTVEARSVPIKIRINNYTNRYTLISQLKGWMKRGTKGNLVVTFVDEGIDYQIPVRVINLIQDPDYPMYFTALLQGVDTAWRSVSAQTDTWHGITGTGGSKSITVGGDDVTRLSLTLTPTAAAGYLYQELVKLPNKPGVNLGWGPWRLTLNTTSMIADNSNKCQINQGGGINNSVTTIPYDTVTGVIPSAGMGMINGLEQIKWTGKTGTTSGNLTGCTRGIGGTTAQSHADNVEIKVSIIQANCADVRLGVNGSDTNRWIADPNTSATKIWFNIWLDVGYQVTLGVAIAGSGTISYIELANTPNNRLALARMARSGILIHGTEWFYYDGINVATRRLTVIKRTFLGTTIQAHNVGDAFDYQQNTIVLSYSNSSASLPDASDSHYDDTKPLFNLSSSDNDSWVYDTSTQFRDINNTGRTGGFATFERKSGTVTELYDITQDADSGNPAMGEKIGSYPRGNGYLPDNAVLRYVLYRACGLNTIGSATGQKFKHGTVYPATAAVQKSTNGVNWLNMFSETAPTTRDLWTAWASHTGVSFGTGFKWMALAFVGQIAGIGAYAMHEILTLTITFITANLPTATLMGRVSNASIDLNLTNNANSTAMDLKGPALLNKVLTIDGENYQVTYDGQNAHDMVRLNDESRAVFIELKPGTNPLQITAADVGVLDVDLSWYKRRL